jgi:hypothetical protein
MFWYQERLQMLSFRMIPPRGAKISSVNVIVMAVILLFSAPNVGSTQDLKQAEALRKQVVELSKAGRHAEAIPLAERVVSILEKELGPSHPDVAKSLNDLASLYARQRRYADAEPLYKRSLAIREIAVGHNHLDLPGSRE